MTHFSTTDEFLTNTQAVSNGCDHSRWPECIKKILAISFRMPPLLSPRSIQIHRLLTHWARRGCEVHVVCVNPSTVPRLHWDQELANLYPNLIHYHFVSFPNSPTNIWQKLRNIGSQIPDPYRRWAHQAESVALDLAKQIQFDLLLTFASPMSDHLTGLGIKKHLRCPWVAHFSDPWVDNPYNAYMNTILSRYVSARQERSVIAQADSVVFVSSETQDLVMRKYPSTWRAKTWVIPHYFDPAIYPKVDPLDVHPKMIFRHIGRFYQHRTPEPLFQALYQLKSEKPVVLEGVVFEMIGPSPPYLLHRLRAKYDLQDCVTIRSSVPYLESLKLMAESDVLMVMDAPVTDPNVFLPSKLVDYLGTGRPLMGITPLRGPSADLIRESKGLVADPRNLSGIVDVIAAYIGEYRMDGLVRRKPGKAIMQAYKVDTVSEHFQELFLQLVEEDDRN
ncbi:MAG: glycosyltransferase family 4 protein [Gemmatimonadetes bacterium]|nr:glycosyltransferase family 4 protein [Gemmatimonadota bacterium]